MSLWDDPELQTSGEFVKFENPGDTIMGVLSGGRKVYLTDPNTKLPRPLAQFNITTDSGEEMTLTVGQQDLKAKLVEQGASDGDHVAIRYREQRVVGAGKKMKLFDVRVTKANGQQVQQQAPQQFAAQPQQAAPQFTAPVQQPPAQAAPQFAAPPAQDPWGQPAQQQDQGFAGEPPF